ncbi:MAG TPA: LacI family DNA-binding transcriptional regulator, partial [Planctomycetota bacterium]|nr:LacI family DNA-binding transcriptional regulator [Planctomycetota bacterium]
MPRTPSTPGIADIAAASDVSIATVSRVLTGKANVTDDVRNRVLSAVKRLNYRPLRRPKRSVIVGAPPEGQKTAIAYLSHEEERRGRVQWNQAFIAA